MNDGTRCLKCGAPSPLVAWSQVDMGVGGVQSFDHEYECPRHGEFAFRFDMSTRPPVAVFRRDLEDT